MIKENDKVLIAKLILKITFIMTFISVGIKLLGFNLFDTDIENNILINFSNFLKNPKSDPFVYVTNFLLLYLQLFIILKLLCKNKQKLIYHIITFISIILNMFSQYLLHEILYKQTPNFSYILYMLFSYTVIITMSLIIDKNQNHKMIKTKLMIKNITIISIIIIVYQLIVLFIRNITINNSFTLIYSYLLIFDYIILLLLTYYIFIQKNLSVKIKSDLFDFKFFNIINTIPDKKTIATGINNLSKSYNNFKKENKTNKIVIVLYIIFFLIHEFINLFLIFFIANLNNYIIECIFILTAFFISKKTFGAFHFKSFILCFFVSNITFFLLSTLTINVDITFIIPITSGVLLSYYASKFIKNNNTTPYRGMPKEDLDSICNNIKINKIEKDILVDFYCNRYNIEKIAIKYSYSDRSIQRIKSGALEKILT